MRKAAWIILLAAMLAAAIVAGCASSGGSPDNSTANKTSDGIEKLIIGTTNTVDSIGLGDGNYETMRIAMVQEALVSQNPQGEWVPGLADSWETSDSQRWVFHLNESATWQDGVPVTSQDVRFTMEYIAKNNLKVAAHIGWVKSVETPDDHTAIINLVSPSSNFLVSLRAALYILPEHVFQNVGDPKKYNEMNASLGCGPYMLTKFDKDAGILTFKAFEDYYRGKPVIDEIEIHMYKNPDTMIMALQKGEIDTVYIYSNGISYYYVPKLLENDNIRIFTVKDGGLKGLWFNTNVTPFSDTRFRKAIADAVDFDEIKNIAIAGYGSAPNAGLVPPAMLYYTDTRPLKEDLNASKSALDTLGYRDIDDDGFRETPDGKRFQPEILVRSSAEYTRPAELIKKNLNAAGIDARLKVVETTTLSALMKNRTYGMVITGTSIAGMTMYAGYGTNAIDASGGLAYSNVNDPALRDIERRLFNATTEDQKKALAAELQEYYADKLPAVPLYWMDLIQPYNKKYEGYVWDPWFGILSYGTFYNLHKA